MHLLDLPRLYLAWQAPFVEQKLVPFRRRHPALPFRRVLDVGCGPGTNSAAFRHCDYLGVDLNAGYIASARKRYAARFEVADAAQLSVADDEKFDCIFVNSLLHHMRDDEVTALLGRASRLLAPNGRIYVLDILLPESRGVALMLARADRGRNVRPYARLRGLLGDVCHVDFEERYALHAGALDLWHMAYFELTPPSGAACA